MSVDTCSRWVGDLLQSSCQHEQEALDEQEALAREGYRFYAEEAEEFAAVSAAAVGEALELELTGRLEEESGRRR